jgi:hypothetical protein
MAAATRSQKASCVQVNFSDMLSFGIHQRCSASGVRMSCKASEVVAFALETCCQLVADSNYAGQADCGTLTCTVQWGALHQQLCYQCCGSHDNKTPCLQDTPNSSTLNHGA